MNPLALVGKVLDRRYRITEFLGRGSFGWTYAAEELLREEPVSTCALKLLWPRSDEERVSAVAAVAAHARRSHPRLLAYRATGEATTPRSLKDTLYVVLELGQQSLAARIEQPERMKASEVLALAVHVCEALAHLEALDTRHRDVKPANLLWVGEGWKLGDFGLVRTLDGSVVKSLGPSATPRYLAPEVLQGKASIASDIWALAVIVQECLTGTLPFSGATEFELLTGIASAEPDIATALPPRLETFVRRSLVREGRWRAAEALAFLTAADVPARLEREVEKDDTDGSSRFFSDVPTRSRTRTAADTTAKPPVAPAAPVPLAAPVVPVALPLSAVPAAVAAGGGGLRVLGQNVQGFEEVENVKDGSRLIRIPAGSFFMGSEAQDY